MIKAHVDAHLRKSMASNLSHFTISDSVERKNGFSRVVIGWRASAGHQSSDYLRGELIGGDEADYSEL